MSKYKLWEGQPVMWFRGGGSDSNDLPEELYCLLKSGTPRGTPREHGRCYRSTEEAYADLGQAMIKLAEKKNTQQPAPKLRVKHSGRIIGSLDELTVDDLPPEFEASKKVIKSLISNIETEPVPPKTAEEKIDAIGNVTIYCGNHTAAAKGETIREAIYNLAAKLPD